MLGRGLGVLLVVLFLQEKVGSRRKEGVRWLARGDRWDRVAVLGTEPAQHVEDLARLAHRLADVVESIGELLEAPGVLGDVHIAWTMFRNSVSR